MRFCENVQDCRRVQQMAYFGEVFNASQCNGTCDVCLQVFNHRLLLTIGKLVTYCDSALLKFPMFFIQIGSVPDTRATQTIHAYDCILCSALLQRWQARKGVSFVKVDVTESAKELIAIASDFDQNSFTLPFLVDVYKGAKTKKVRLDSPQWCGPTWFCPISVAG